MIHYLYHCDHCHIDKIVIKSMDDCLRPEYCDACKQELRRDFTSYSSMTIQNDRNWQEVKWKGGKPPVDIFRNADNL